MADVETFLAPLSEGNPSGAELRNDLRFHAIERRVQPATRQSRKEAESSGGPGASAVDWNQVLDEAQALSAAGRDLRLLVVVVRALTNTEGFAGLADGLTLLARTVEGFWETVHPALRDSPSKREAAVRRINALFQIENPDDGLLGDLDFLVVMNVRGLGPVTAGDLSVAMQNQSQVLANAPGLGAKEQTEMLAAHEARAKRVVTTCKTYAAERPEEVAALRDALRAARTRLGSLERAIDERVADGDGGIRFKLLDGFLSRVEQTLAAHVAEVPAEAAQPADPEPTGSDAAGPATAPVEAPAPAARPAGVSVANGTGLPSQVNSRSDVERCLDLIIDFYERTEPSSPIPHLARRMRKMVPMNFMQLMEEIAPSGMKEFRSVAGVFDEKPK